MERVYQAAPTDCTLSSPGKLGQQASDVSGYGVRGYLCYSPWHKIKNSTNTRRRSGSMLPKYTYPVNIGREKAIALEEFSMVGGNTGRRQI